MKYSIIIFTIFLSFITFAQSPAKSVFFELGGPGLASVNYDMRFTKSEKGIGGRVGLGGFSITDFDERVSFLFVPIGINYLMSKDEKNYFEVGTGFTPVIASSKFDNDKESFTTTFGHLTFGYRLQPKNGGFTFRAHMTPVFGKGFFIPYWASLSFGYKF
jgi:hypothetical protein